MEDEQLPIWAQRVVEINQGVDLENLTVKLIEASDLSSHHNCFSLTDGIVGIHLVPYLTVEERGEAGFINLIDLNSSPSSAERSCSGLKVTVYVRAMEKVEDLLLIHSDKVGGTVIAGDNMEVLRKASKFQVGDTVEIWMFRVPNNFENKKELCFIFVKQN